MKRSFATKLTIFAIAAWLTLTVNGFAANLLLGLNANDLVLADGQAVSTWDSGFGNATQTNPTWQPSFVASSTFMNGNSAVRFDDGAQPNGDGMITSASGLGSDYTIMALYAHRQGGTDAARVVQGSNGTRNSNLLPNNWLLGPYNNQNQLYDGAFISAGVTTTAPVLVTAVGSSTVVEEFYSNGGLIGTNNGTTTPGTVALGAEGNWAESADSDLGAGQTKGTHLIVLGERWC